MTQEIYVAAGVRSALGNFGGTLKDKPMTELAQKSCKAALNDLAPRPPILTTWSSPQPVQPIKTRCLRLGWSG